MNKDLIWRMLIGEIVLKLEAIKYWETTTQHSIIHDLRMEISGIVGLASKVYAIDRRKFLI